MTLFVVSVLVAMTVSFICSLLEAALLSLSPSQLADISERRPAVGRVWQGFKTNIERPIAAILILNTAAHTIGAAVAGSQFNTIADPKWLWVFSLAFTWMMLQFTEILPKTIGVRFNREIAVTTTRPMTLMVRIMTPLQRLVHWLNRPFAMKRQGSAAPATVEEISALAGLARLTEQISARQERIIKRASRLSVLRARHVMIPVQQVSFLSTAQTLPEALIAAHIDAHTRFPVCENDDRDHVVGYVNFKEMIYFMRTNPNDPSFRGVIRPVAVAAPDQSASTLLEMFVNEHIHMAIVKDDAGKTLGLVTLEDIVEELVGEIEDEFDRLPRMVHPLSGQMWMAGGGVPLAELRRQIGLDLPNSQETVSSWLLNRLGPAPKPGDVHHEAGAEFVVRRTRRANIFEVSISRLEA